MKEENLSLLKMKQILFSNTKKLEVTVGLRAIF